MVGVVVCAYNEQRHIQVCLEALLDQLGADDDLLLVDDGSTDATAAIGELIGVRVLRQAHRGAAVARNAGAAAVRGDVLVFVDGDMVCLPGYLENLVAPLTDPKCLATFAKDMYVARPEDPWSTAYCHIRRLAHPRLLPKEACDQSANVRALRREQFLAVGGYDDVGYGEDMTLAPKLGGLADAAVGASLLHFNPDTPWEIFENARWIGRGFDVQYVAHPVRDNLPWAALRRAINDLARGAPWQVIPARLAYSTGFLVGLASRRWRPRQHWK
jgi:glycosyltransferase involved in cell wall biosynthesis